ncbi:hypothetical protein R1flu_024154 [Riccia fluitans]|uniref:Ig-like domain-containing protein n=1 Tax=Riccia fluitans TaxID=41844 RepID=A0ABD1XU91_9MARC
MPLIISLECARTEIEGAFNNKSSADWWQRGIKALEEVNSLMKTAETTLNIARGGIGNEERNQTLCALSSNRQLPEDFQVNAMVAEVATISLTEVTSSPLTIKHLTQMQHALSTSCSHLEESQNGAAAAENATQHLAEEINTTSSADQQTNMKSQISITASFMRITTNDERQVFHNRDRIQARHPLEGRLQVSTP